MAEECGINPVCKMKDNLADALANVTDNALQSIADAVTAAVTTTIAQLGTMWTTLDAGDLTGSGSTDEQPAGGVFNEKVDALLGYATWIGLGVSTMAIILLAVSIAANARRGDGTGLVNAATIIFSGATLIGGATALIGYIVPARSSDIAPTLGFIQDQTFYLTLALAVFSTIIAGARMVWTQRAEPAQDLLKGLLTLAVVSASGVALLNILLQATDALAEQIIDAAIGADFTADVQAMLGFSVTTPTEWITGNVMLIIVGGLIAVMVNLVQIMLMVLRVAMLFLLAGVLPLSAAFMNTEAGKSWFAKIIAWTLAFAFYKPAAALIYATGIKLSSSGLFSGQSLLQFCAGLILIIASVVALPMLIGFLSPALGAMSSSGGGVPLSLSPQSLPGGAQGRQRGNGFPSAPAQGRAQKSTSGGGPPAGSDPSGGGSPAGGGRTTGGGTPGTGHTAGTGSSAGGRAKAGTRAKAGAGAGGGAAAAAPPIAVAAVAVQAAKKAADAISGTVQKSVQESNAGSGDKTGSGSAPASPAASDTPPSGSGQGTGRTGTQKPARTRRNRQPPANHHGNEGSPDGTDGQ